MRTLFQNNRAVLICYTAILVFCGILMVLYERNAINLYVNQYVGNRYVNAFFFFMTYLGDGVLAPFFVLALSVVNVRAGLVAALGLIAASLISTLLKYQVFDDVHRPYFIFQYFDRHDLNLVKGVDLHIHNSFPSGHATQVFSIFMAAIFTAGRNLFKFLFLGLAVLAAFSRVYLSQHWLIDIVAGSLLGTFCSFIFYAMLVGKNRVARLNRPMKDLLARKP